MRKSHAYAWFAHNLQKYRAKFEVRIVCGLLRITSRSLLHKNQFEIELFSEAQHVETFIHRQLTYSIRVMLLLDHGKYWYNWWCTIALLQLMMYCCFDAMLRNRYPGKRVMTSSLAIWTEFTIDSFSDSFWLYRINCGRPFMRYSIEQKYPYDNLLAILTFSAPSLHTLFVCDVTYWLHQAHTYVAVSQSRTSFDDSCQRQQYVNYVVWRVYRSIVWRVLRTTWWRPSDVAECIGSMRWWRQKFSSGLDHGKCWHDTLRMFCSQAD